MKKLWINFKNTSKSFKILLILLILVSIFSYNYITMLNNTHISTKPSDADIKAGLEKTFGSIENIKCEYYDKMTYQYPTYKYTCTFDYKLDDIEEKDYSTCTLCIMKNNVWTCSLSSKECFK